MNATSERGSTAVTRWMLSNGAGFEVFPASPDDLVRGLVEIDLLARTAGQPRMAVLTADADAEDAPYLSIGLGGQDSVLVFEGGQQGGYSKGARSGDDSPVFFAYGTGTGEYLGWMAVSKQQAFEAAQEFFRTGKQPSCVDWEDL
jgi:hypothetical protein